MPGPTTTSSGSSGTPQVPPPFDLKYAAFVLDHLNGSPGVDARGTLGPDKSTPVKLYSVLGDVGFKGQLKACPPQTDSRVELSFVWTEKEEASGSPHKAPHQPSKCVSQSRVRTGSWSGSRSGVTVGFLSGRNSGLVVVVDERHEQTTSLLGRDSLLEKGGNSTSESATPGHRP